MNGEDRGGPEALPEARRLESEVPRCACCAGRILAIVILGGRPTHPQLLTDYGLRRWVRRSLRSSARLVGVPASQSMTWSSGQRMRLT
jgi:hypothetical protein